MAILFHRSIDIGLPAVAILMDRGVSVAIERIDLGFPAGFHALLQGNVRQSDIIEFQSVKGMVTKVIVD